MNIIMGLKILLFSWICIHMAKSAQVSFLKGRDLHVKLQPSGKFDYSHIIAEKYKSIFLSCEVNKPIDVNISWQHNHFNITHPPPYRIPWSRGSILMVRPLLEKFTDGLFECIVRDSNSVVKKGVYVDIKEEKELPPGFPVINTHPQDVHTPRTKVDFNCVVIGEPPLTITWFHDHIPVPADSVHQISLVSIGKSFTSNLMIQDVSLVKEGFYKCVATNEIGQVVSKHAKVLFSYNAKKRHRRGISSQVQLERNLYRALMPKMNSVIENHATSERTRRQLPEQYGHYKTGCKGSDRDPNGYPGKITEEDIEANCRESKDQQGYFFHIRWTLPTDAKSKSIQKYQLVFSYNGNKLCHFVNGTRMEFSFGKSKGFIVNQSYEVAIIPHPIPTFLRTTSIKIGKCPRDSTYPPITDPPITDTTIEVNVAQSTDHNDTESKKKWLPILGGVFGGLLLIAFAILLHKKRTKPYVDVNEAHDAMDVYVSHCAVDNKEEEKVLQLSSFMSLYGISVCIDLCSQVEINRMGGLPHWVPEKMSSVDKIVLVLTSSYLQALRSAEKFTRQYPDKVCKVNTEFNYIKTLLYHKSCQRTPQLVVLLDGVKQDIIPDLCKGRTLCHYPKNFNDKDENVHILLGLLLDTEPIQIAPVHENVVS